MTPLQRVCGPGLMGSNGAILSGGKASLMDKTVLAWTVGMVSGMIAPAT